MVLSAILQQVALGFGRDASQTLLWHCSAKQQTGCRPALQGVRIFGEILHFFERWNNWGGWGIFIGLFIANVTLFLPGVALILGAGFIFGCVLRLVNRWVEY